MTATDDRKTHLTNPEVGHVTGAEAILLSEPHPDWAGGRTIGLLAWDGELVAQIEFKDAKAANAANGPLRKALARAIRLAFPTDDTDRQPAPSARYDAVTRPRVSTVYDDSAGWRGFDLVDDFNGIVATVGFETEADALLARAAVVAALVSVFSLLSGPDFMAQEQNLGGPAEVTGDYD